jgi:hypothetical protein
MQVSEQGVSVSGRRAQHHAKTLRDKFGTSKKLSIQDAEILRQLGFSANRNAVFDAAPVALTTTASITNPVQFLQTFLPGVVRIFQAPLKLEETIGFTQAGFWEDSEIVQRVMEWTGYAREFGDYQAKPNVNWNMNFEKRSVVRFEVGVEVQTLQERRAARGMVSDTEEKQGAAALILQQVLNLVGYNGYNSGNNLTYGYLNDPGLPAYVPVASTGTGPSPLWSTKTWLLQQADLIAMFSGLMTQTKGRVDPAGPNGTPTTLNIPVSMWAYFQGTNTLGTLTLSGWLEQAYPNCRVISSPQMDGAASSLNAMYLFADEVENTGSDDGSTFRQVIPAKFMALGTQQLVGGYKMGYSCATAGTFCLRPVAVYRASSM